NVVVFPAFFAVPTTTTLRAAAVASAYSASAADMEELEARKAQSRRDEHDAGPDRGRLFGDDPQPLSQREPDRGCEYRGARDAHDAERERHADVEDREPDAERVEADRERAEHEPPAAREIEATAFVGSVQRFVDHVAADADERGEPHVPGRLAEQLAREPPDRDAEQRHPDLGDHDDLRDRGEGHAAGSRVRPSAAAASRRRSADGGPSSGSARARTAC